MHAPNEVEAVAATVEGDARFVALDVCGEELDRVGGHVGRNRGDDVERRVAPDGFGEVGDDRPHAVAPGAGGRAHVEVGGDDRRRRHLCGEVHGDRAGAGAQVDRPAVFR